ncbi:hypothetical protein PATSB16_16640 [Pandoraea thiooxydans]|uniref:Uncharacterized protein n=1 Tax=Pandoraea thiooxydans TaxID=445709 RepID=A0A0G3EP71_9BURK|nr:phasin family protein [Pandoraea thiooxydans]AKJ67824.1 hypothetical protein ABW99_05945 [Pandoraea thiooxydans]APR95006.1 hypothetical protein PATSB16_16640 [Pandoraea thiooxydans]
MPFNASALQDLHQANVDLGARLGHIFLEQASRMQARTLQDAQASAAALCESMTDITGGTNAAAAMSLPMQLMGRQIEQAGNFWRNFLTGAQNHQQTVLEHLNEAMGRWQVDCIDAIERISDTTPAICAAGMVCQPLSIAAQQVFDVVTATFGGLRPVPAVTPAPADAVTPIPHRNRRVA